MVASEPTTTLCQPHPHHIAAPLPQNARMPSSARAGDDSVKSERLTPSPLEPAQSFSTGHIRPQASPYVELQEAQHAGKRAGVGTYGEWIEAGEARSGGGRGRAGGFFAEGTARGGTGQGGGGGLPTGARYMSAATVLLHPEGVGAGVARGKARHESRESTSALRYQSVGTQPMPLPSWCLTIPGV